MIIFGPWPTDSANARWVSGVRCWIDESLDVSGEHGAESDRRDVAEEIHGDAGFVAVGVRDHHAGGARARLEDRPECRVELCVHEDDVLSMLDRREAHLETEIHLSGRIHDDVDALRAADQQGIRRDDGRAPSDGILELGERRDLAGDARPVLGVDVSSPLDRAVGDRDDLDARR